MDVPHGFDPTLILSLNLAGTFVFGRRSISIKSSVDA